MKRSFAVSLALAVLAAVALVVAPASSARQVGLKVRAVTSCSPTNPYVRLADGTVERVPHARPGRLVSRLTRASSGFRLLVQMGASWGTVARGDGQRLVITASGPRHEVWQFGLRLRAANPLADSTNYEACIALVSTKGKPFLARMRSVRGRWRFDVQVAGGSLAPSRGGYTVTVA